MVNKRFGHVGDEGAKIVEAPENIPRFDQTHVEYLKKVFNIGGVCPILAKSVDDAVAVISWHNADMGQREVIAHIENLVASQKGTL